MTSGEVSPCPSRETQRGRRVTLVFEPNIVDEACSFPFTKLSDGRSLLNFLQHKLQRVIQCGNFDPSLKSSAEASLKEAVDAFLLNSKVRGQELTGGDETAESKHEIAGVSREITEPQRTQSREDFSIDDDEYNSMLDDPNIIDLQMNILEQEGIGVLDAKYDPLLDDPNIIALQMNILEKGGVASKDEKYDSLLDDPRIIELQMNIRGQNGDVLLVTQSSTGSVDDIINALRGSDSTMNVFEREEGHPKSTEVEQTIDDDKLDIDAPEEKDGRAKVARDCGCSGDASDFGGTETTPSLQTVESHDSSRDGAPMVDDVEITISDNACIEVSAFGNMPDLFLPDLESVSETASDTRGTQCCFGDFPSKDLPIPTKPSQLPCSLDSLDKPQYQMASSSQDPATSTRDELQSSAGFIQIKNLQDSRSSTRDGFTQMVDCGTQTVDCGMILAPTNLVPKTAKDVVKSEGGSRGETSSSQAPNSEKLSVSRDEDELLTTVAPTENLESEATSIVEDISPSGARVSKTEEKDIAETAPEYAKLPLKRPSATSPLLPSKRSRASAGTKKRSSRRLDSFRPEPLSDLGLEADDEKEEITFSQREKPTTTSPLPPSKRARALPETRKAPVSLDSFGPKPLVFALDSKFGDEREDTSFSQQNHPTPNKNVSPSNQDESDVSQSEQSSFDVPSMEPRNDYVRGDCSSKARQDHETCSVEGASLIESRVCEASTHLANKESLDDMLDTLEQAEVKIRVRSKDEGGIEVTAMEEGTDEVKKSDLPDDKATGVRKNDPPKVEDTDPLPRPAKTDPSGIGTKCDSADLPAHTQSPRRPRALPESLGVPFQADLKIDRFPPSGVTPNVQDAQQNFAVMPQERSIMSFSSSLDEEGSTSPHSGSTESFPRAGELIAKNKTEQNIAVATAHALIEMEQQGLTRPAPGNSVPTEDTKVSLPEPVLSEDAPKALDETSWDREHFVPPANELGFGGVSGVGEEARCNDRSIAQIESFGNDGEAYIEMTFRGKAVGDVSVIESRLSFVEEDTDMTLCSSSDSTEITGTSASTNHASPTMNDASQFRKSRKPRVVPESPLTFNLESKVRDENLNTITPSPPDKNRKSRKAHMTSPILPVGEVLRMSEPNVVVADAADRDNKENFTPNNKVSSRLNDGEWSEKRAEEDTTQVTESDTTVPRVEDITEGVKNLWSGEGRSRPPLPRNRVRPQPDQRTPSVLKKAPVTASLEKTPAATATPSSHARATTGNMSQSESEGNAGESRSQSLRRQHRVAPEAPRVRVPLDSSKKRAIKTKALAFAFIMQNPNPPPSRSSNTTPLMGASCSTDSSHSLTNEELHSVGGDTSTAEKSISAEQTNEARTMTKDEPREDSVSPGSSSDLAGEEAMSSFGTGSNDDGMTYSSSAEGGRPVSNAE